jgi:hypothetical protein
VECWVVKRMQKGVWHRVGWKCGINVSEGACGVND